MVVFNSSMAVFHTEGPGATPGHRTTHKMPVKNMIAVHGFGKAEGGVQVPGLAPDFFENERRRPSGRIGFICRSVGRNTLACEKFTTR
jgi:hypothetical protein